MWDYYKLKSLPNGRILNRVFSRTYEGRKVQSFTPVPYPNWLLYADFSSVPNDTEVPNETVLGPSEGVTVGSLTVYSTEEGCTSFYNGAFVINPDSCSNSYIHTLHETVFHDHQFAVNYSKFSSAEGATTTVLGGLSYGSAYVSNIGFRHKAEGLRREATIEDDYGTDPCDLITDITEDQEYITILGGYNENGEPYISGDATDYTYGYYVFYKNTSDTEDKWYLLDTQAYTDYPLYQYQGAKNAVYAYGNNGTSGGITHIKSIKSCILPAEKFLEICAPISHKSAIPTTLVDSDNYLLHLRFSSIMGDLKTFQLVVNDAGSSYYLVIDFFRDDAEFGGGNYYVIAYSYDGFPGDYITEQVIAPYEEYVIRRHNGRIIMYAKTSSKILEVFDAPWTGNRVWGGTTDTNLTVNITYHKIDSDAYTGLEVFE